MADYSKGKIYRIVSDKTDQVYIGSTVQTLERRFGVHKSHFKKGTYCASAELLKLGDARIELVRDFPCNSKRELEKVEDDEMIACCKVVNCQRASRTRVEWYKDNKEERIEKGKAYYQANKAEIDEKGKAYYEANRAVIAEYHKEYYEANRAEINEKSKQKYNCPCGSTLRKGEKSRHEKSAKHQKYIILKQSK